MCVFNYTISVLMDPGRVPATYMPDIEILKALFTRSSARRLKVAVVGVPKTIDNDILLMDKTFGFDTAVEEAQRAINSAYIEAHSAYHGIGIVKLMGRSSGFIAMHASLSSGQIDICLIPETTGSAMICVAEGAGQDLLEKTNATDASGNVVLGDIVHIQQETFNIIFMALDVAGKIVRSPYGVMHGKSSLVYYDEKGDDGLFAGLSKYMSLSNMSGFLLLLRFLSTAGRYHNLVIDKDSFPHEALEVTAWTEDGLIMAARHKKYRHIQGVQFHTESIITSEGMGIVHNFIKMVERADVRTKN
ncbi:hypothetical protein FNV43_RR10984 [Rhamnella rubrinervis]|uniref:Phosphofructokinase domain-containing protein n=1 Tax=Rhamnella rubrinervis TaxID=2594499 RepID=A0A8K0MHB3_9ROSA|nr:hypothetical protein FNV43_RR10984 [Rhamnella rubrinervis]